MTVKFPHNTSFIKQNYYTIHARYFMELFKYENFKIEFYDSEKQEHEVVFKIYINDKPLYVDFGDHQIIHTNKRPLVKCHLNDNYVGDIIPYSPISFYNWDEYFKLEKEIKYAFKDKILNNQTPGGNALERRQILKNVLLSNFKNDFDFEQTNQTDYWKKINNAKIAVFAPGARIDILDRGQFQYMAFGCCTISPDLNDLLPFERVLVPDVHYIKCKNDFSDVVEIINNLDKNKCIQIGNNAKKLFKETSTPKIIIENILTKLKTY